MLGIYRPFVEHTAVSFETTVPSVEQFADRITETLATHEWLLAEHDGEVLGYAYGSRHRARDAYRSTCEVSAYVADDAQRCGVGRELYGCLFDRLDALGFCNALAGVAMPNDKSVAFHRAMGFTLVGVYHHVGYKLGAWHDVAWYERVLREGPPR